MIEPLQYTGILEKLLRKTADGRLDWSAADNDRFLCQLDEKYVFTVWRTEGGFGAKMEAGTLQFLGGLAPSPEWQEPPARVFEITIDDRIYFESPEEKRAFELLSDLHEVARRSALRVPERLSEAAQLLDKI